MPRPEFRVTFDYVTPESAEHGEAERSGFVEPGNWHHELGNESPQGMTLREALQLCQPCEDSGRWFTGHPETDYRDGGDETRSIHPPRNITPASYARLRRVLLGK